MSIIDSNFILLFSISGMFCLALIEFFFPDLYRKRVNGDWQDRAITVGLSGFVILSIFEIIGGITFALILILSFISLIFTSKRYDFSSKVYIIITSSAFIILYIFLQHWVVALIPAIIFFPVYYFYKKGNEGNGDGV